jgi:hypothetical protein
MSKIDNIFAKVISNPQLCREYGITDPERYDNIVSGIKSSNGYVSAIATILKEVNTAYELQKQDMAIRRKEGTPVLQDNDMKSIYRKVVGILEKTR